MAKIKTNKAKKKSKSVEVSADNKSIPNTEKNPNYSIRQISNGWLVSKSWNDKEGYHSEEIYHKEKPAGLDAMVDDDDQD